MWENTKRGGGAGSLGETWNIAGQKSKPTEKLENECFDGFNCEGLYTGACTNHYEKENLAAEQINCLRSKYKMTAFAYYNENGDPKLYRFNKIPVHFADQTKDYPQNAYYKIQILMPNAAGTSIAMKSLQTLECHLQNDLKIVDSYYAGDNLQPDKNPSAADGKKQPEEEEEKKTFSTSTLDQQASSHNLITSESSGPHEDIRLEQNAPDFTAETSIGKIRFHEWLGDSWGVIFSHCNVLNGIQNAKLGYAAKIKPEFEKRQVKVIGISLDPVQSHQKQDGHIDETQETQINFPMIQDPECKVRKVCGMMDRQPDLMLPDLRVFVISPDKKVKNILVYPSSKGIDFDQVIRVIDQLQQKTFFGYLINTLKGHVLVNFEKNFKDMIVLDIAEPIYREIKVGQVSSQFSCVRESQIRKNYINRYFFEAELLNNPNQGSQRKYCRITKVLGLILDQQVHRQLIYSKNGVYHQMYPNEAVEEGKQIVRQFNSDISSQKVSPLPLVFTIDDFNTQSFDDALSITSVPNKNPALDPVYKIEIYISDVARLIKQDSCIDREAFKRRETRIIKGDQYIPMLPQEFNNEISSLSKQNKRYALSLSVVMSKDGIADFTTLDYQQKTIEVVYNLRYHQAENLINNKQPNDLENKVSQQNQNQLQKNLKDFAQLSKSRRALRKQFEGDYEFTESIREDYKTSRMIVKEMMLLTQSCIKYYMENTLREAYKIHDKLKDYEAKRALQKNLLSNDLCYVKSEVLQFNPQLNDLNFEPQTLKKHNSYSSYQEEQLYSPQPFIGIQSTIGAQSRFDIQEDDEGSSQDYNVNIQKEEVTGEDIQTQKHYAASRKQNLIDFFKEKGVNIQFGSKEEIIQAFDRARRLNESEAYQKYIDFYYTIAYKHFPSMIDQTNLQNQNAQIDQQLLGEIIGESEPNLDEVIDELLGFEEEDKKQETSHEYLFDEALNKKIIHDLSQISRDKYLKFQNPIRDYFDLLSNRLLLLLIDLKKNVKDADINLKNLRNRASSTQKISSSEKKTLLDDINNVGIKIQEVLKHLRYQFAYQYDIKFVQHHQAKGNYHVEVRLLDYAFKILEKNDIEESKFNPVLDISGLIKGSIEIVHVCSSPSSLTSEYIDIYHPVLALTKLRLDKLENGQINQRTIPAKNSNPKILTKIKTLVPLEFENYIWHEPRQNQTQRWRN